MELDVSRVEAGIEKYRRIMARLHAVDVSQDLEFQRAYNGFYRVRQQPADFYAGYYRFLEDNKYNVNLDFKTVLEHLYQQTGRIQASFGSKLLATVNPQMPVWDKYVLQNLGLRPTQAHERDRLEKTVRLYGKICDWYSTEEAGNCLAVFNAHFPGLEITDTKKIDFILWATRET